MVTSFRLPFNADIPFLLVSILRFSRKWQFRDAKMKIQMTPTYVAAGH
jgi:hypothetical protein